MYAIIDDVINNCELAQQFMNNRIKIYKDKDLFYYLIFDNVLINLKENKMKLEIPEFETQKEIEECKGCMFEKYLNGEICSMKKVIKSYIGADCVVGYNGTCDEFPSFLNKYDTDTNK